MGAILNGMSLVKVRPFGSGFFIFVDYMRGSLRLSALMELPVIYVFTHDSIGVGEDGPTHQPIEQLAHMRSMPGLILIRPADANEVTEAWKVILQLHHEPAVLVLTRQAVPTIDRTKYAAASGLARGAYVLADAPGGDPEVILIGTGSEVALCLEAYEQLIREGVRARVVSMPSWELFDDQDQSYRESVLPPQSRRAFGGTGIRLRLEQIYRLRRPQHRHRNLWSVGAAEATAEEIWFQRRKRCGRGEEPDRRHQATGRSNESGIGRRSRRIRDEASSSRSCWRQRATRWSISETKSMTRTTTIRILQFLSRGPCHAEMWNAAS